MGYFNLTDNFQMGKGFDHLHPRLPQTVLSRFGFRILYPLIQKNRVLVTYVVNRVLSLILALCNATTVMSYPEKKHRYLLPVSLTASVRSITHILRISQRYSELSFDGSDGQREAEAHVTASGARPKRKEVNERLCVLELAPAGASRADPPRRLSD